MVLKAKRFLVRLAEKADKTRYKTRRNEIKKDTKQDKIN